MRRITSLFIIIISLFFVGFTLALFIQNWPFKILTSPAPQVLIISTVSLLVSGLFWFLGVGRSGFSKNLFVAGVGVVVLVFAVFCIIYTHLIQPPAVVSSISDASNPITVTTYNRLYENTDKLIPANYIGSTASDIVVLQEIHDQNYALEFSKLLGFEYVVQSPNNDVAIISRWPIVNSSVLQNVDKQVVRAEVETPRGVIAVFGIHITPPFSSSMYFDGLQELRNLSDWVASETLPVVVMGDYNTAIYAPEMRAHVSAIARVVKPTTEQAWPDCSRYGTFIFACLRIDYVFIPVSSEFYGSTISPDLGSDHRAVTVQFGL